MQASAALGGQPHDALRRHQRTVHIPPDGVLAHVRAFQGDVLLAQPGFVLHMHGHAPMAMAQDARSTSSSSARRSPKELPMKILTPAVLEFSSSASCSAFTADPPT